MRGCLNVPVNLKSKKQLVARMYKVGVNWVQFDSDHLDDIADAITRENIRSLFTANTIKIKENLIKNFLKLIVDMSLI